MYVRNPTTGEVRALPQTQCLALRKYGWQWAKAEEYRRWIVQKALRPIPSTVKH